jgi:hypothetical protein
MACKLMSGVRCRRYARAVEREDWYAIMDLGPMLPTDNSAEYVYRDLVSGIAYKYIYADIGPWSLVAKYITQFHNIPYGAPDTIITPEDYGPIIIRKMDSDIFMIRVDPYSFLPIGIGGYLLSAKTDIDVRVLTCDRDNDMVYSINNKYTVYRHILASMPMRQYAVLLIGEKV